MRKLSFLIVVAMIAGLVGVASAEVPEELSAELLPIVQEGLVSEDVAVQAWAIRAAGLLGERDLRENIVSALENTNSPVRIAAAMSLISMDHEVDDAQGVLTSEILEGDAQTRTLILDRFLGILPTDVRAEVLEASLDGASGDTLRQIIRHIAQREEGEIYELLLRVGSAPDEDTRNMYVRAIANANRDIGLVVAEDLINSGDGALQAAGAEIAMELGTPDAQTALEALLTAEDAALAEQVGFHLAQYGNASALGLVANLAANTEQDEALRIEAMALLRDNGPELVEFSALTAITEETERSREFMIAAYELMGATQTSDAIARLNELMAAPFAEDRLYGIAGMGYAGQPDAIADIRETMESNGEQFLREVAAEALGNIGGDEAGEILLGALRTGAEHRHEGRHHPRPRTHRRRRHRANALLRVRPTG